MGKWWKSHTTVGGGAYLPSHIRFTGSHTKTMLLFRKFNLEWSFSLCKRSVAFSFFFSLLQPIFRNRHGVVAENISLIWIQLSGACWEGSLHLSITIRPRSLSNHIKAQDHSRHLSVHLDQTKPSPGLLYQKAQLFPYTKVFI